MMPMAIRGIGPVGAFGAGLDEWRATLKGERKVEPELIAIETEQGACNLPVFRASTSPLKAIIKSRELRRLDHFSKLALLGALLACEDAGQTLISERTGLIVASAYGASATTFSFLDSVINDGDVLASPTLFSNSVHNAAAAHIAKYLNITGPNLSLTQGHLSVPMALITAAHWLTEGRVDAVLCGAVDEYCDVLGYCWQSYLNRKTTTTRKNLNPDLKPCGPGEGSLFFWLSRAEKTNTPYAYLEKIEQNAPEPTNKTLNDTVPLISSPNTCHNHLESRISQRKKYLQQDLSQYLGALPIITAFDLAVAATMLSDQTLYSNKPLRHPQSLPFSGPAICCWQPDYETSRKPLTGNCYWITNRVNL